MSRLNLVFLFVFVVLLVWISFFQADKVARLQKGTLTLFHPFIKASGQISDAAGSLEKERMSYGELDDAYRASVRERDRLRLEVLQLDEILYENNELRKALLYKNRSPLNLLSARVMNRKTNTWYNTVMIDKGAEDGVLPDRPVIVPGEGDAANLVGKVSEVVGPHQSIVLLLTDEMCQVPARIEGTEEQGILSGERAPVRNNPTLNLRYLAKNVTIRPGDRIISSGIGEVFRENLVLGRVESSKRGVIDTEAVIVPATNFEKLKDVFVVMRNTPAFEDRTDYDGDKPNPAKMSASAERR